MQDITVRYYVNIWQIWTTQLATFDAILAGGIGLLEIINY